MSRVKAQLLDKVCALPECGKSFQVPDKTNYRERLYCSRPCSNKATANKRSDAIRAAKRYQPPVCPCGKEVQRPPGQQYIYANQKKYCSPEHRALYGKKRQKDPANWVTFNCLNCDKEVTRPKNYGGNQVQKYCSNECSAKHNRTKQHIVVEDALVLDSPYEALFYGLCRLWKVPVDRADRSLAVPVNGNGWYCPDFYMPDPVLDLWVEVKGAEDDDDPARWSAWRESGRKLAVIRREELLSVCQATRPAQLVGRLRLIAAGHLEALPFA